MDNRQQAKELAGKLNQIQLEIDAKTQKIKELRQENSRLIEMNLNKQRKPPSLRIGREQIFQINNELEELELTKISLKERLESANSDIRQEQIKLKVSQFRENSKVQLSLVESVRRAIKELERSLIELEKNSGKNHVLYRILQMLWDDREGVEKEISLDSVLTSWSPSNTIIDFSFDELVQRLDRMRVDTGNFWNQLSSLRENKRSYHRVEPMKPVNQKIGGIQDVRRLMAQEEAKEYRELQKKQPKRRHINHNVVAHG